MALNSVTSANVIYIQVHGQIKEAVRVHNLVIPQFTGWITSYPPIVIGYIHNTNLKFIDFGLAMTTKFN